MNKDKIFKEEHNSNHETIFKGYYLNGKREGK